MALRAPVLRNSLSVNELRGRRSGFKDIARLDDPEGDAFGGKFLRVDIDCCIFPSTQLERAYSKRCA